MVPAWAQIPREPLPPPACLRPSYSLHCRPGLRGAIPYALSLHLDLEPMEKRQLVGTTTISIVLFTILLLGGSTMPLIRFADVEDARARRRSKKDVNLSKTEKMVSASRPGRQAGGQGQRVGPHSPPESGETIHDLRMIRPWARTHGRTAHAHTYAPASQSDKEVGLRV